MRRIDRWMFESIDARQLAALRIGLSATLLVRLFFHDFVELPKQDSELFRPLSYMKLFDSMPPTPLVQVLWVIAVVAAAISLVGCRSRIALPIATVCALVLFGMTTSLGKVMHNEVLLMLCLLPVSFGTTDEVWSITSWLKARSAGARSKSRQVISGWPWRVTLLLVCGAYFFSGLAKLTHSGPAWAFSDNMRWILYANSDGRVAPNHLSVFIADHVWLARLSGFSILLLELSFPLVLWRARLAWLFVASAAGMHAMTYLTLGLDYSAMAAVDLTVLLFWPSIAERLRRPTG